MKRYMTCMLVAALCLGTAFGAKEIIVKGSDTMLNLVQRLAEAYGNTQADATVSVTGGGSGVGINAIVNNNCDIADASRSITSKEISDARSNGVEPVQIVVGIDGLSLIDNQDNPVKQLTKSQIGAIYRGDIKNWKDVGGPNMKITLYGRQPSSGTFTYLRDEVMKGDYDAGMLQMNGNSQICEAMKNDKSGIGYCGAGYAKSAEGVNVLSVAKDANSEYVSPLDADKVNNGDYPITRPLFQYTVGKPGGAVKDFIMFEVGADGQKIVQDEGFFPINAKYQAQNDGKLK